MQSPWKPELKNALDAVAYRDESRCVPFEAGCANWLPSKTARQQHLTWNIGDNSAKPVWKHKGSLALTPQISLFGHPRFWLWKQSHNNLAHRRPCKAITGYPVFSEPPNSTPQPPPCFVDISSPGHVTWRLSPYTAISTSIPSSQPSPPPPHLFPSASQSTTQALHPSPAVYNPGHTTETLP